MSTTPVPFTSSIVSACRSGLGDALRSVIYVTPRFDEVLYLRQDLIEATEAGVRRDEFVDIERTGFTARDSYNELSAEPGTEPSLGRYVATIRLFTDGFVTRVIVGDHGVVVTTDELDISSFEELAVALRRLLADAHP